MLIVLEGTDEAVTTVLLKAGSLGNVRSETLRGFSVDGRAAPVAALSLLTECSRSFSSLRAAARCLGRARQAHLQPIIGPIVPSRGWFAARAYCESHNAHLPTWIEWEFAAAADEHVADARRNPVWRQTIIATLGRSPGSPLPAVGLKAPNFYGIHDLHGVVWEWVEDFDTLFMPRGHSEHEHADMAMSPGDTAMSCGAAALSVTDPENYPMILRLAVLSALNRTSTTADLGFRCAHSISSPAAARAAPRRD
jgi:hypothetical protein